MAKSLKEYFNPGRTVSTLGALKFRQSIFRDETRYPHWEMDRSMQLYEQRPQVNSGINQFVSFLLGEAIVAASEDEKSQAFLQSWLDKRPTVKREIRHATTTGIVTGNGYVEPTYTKTKNGTDVIDNFFSVNDSSRVFYNLDTVKTINEFWLYEVPIEIKVFPWGGENLFPKFYRVNYVRGSILFQKMVYGILLHKDKLKHMKLGWSRDGIYGRSFLASAIDDGEILLEILKNLAIISRSRALNIKLLTIGTEDDKATPEDVEKLQGDFKTRLEDEHLIINKPVKQMDLSHQGQYDVMDSSTDFLRKDISSGLVPNHLTPWNSEINRATASETRIPFQLRLQDTREEIMKFFNELIVDSLRKAYPWLADDLHLDVTQVDMTPPDEKMNNAAAMFLNNALTMNEYRQSAGYERAVGGDKWAYQLTSLPMDAYGATETTTTKVDEPIAPGGEPEKPPEAPPPAQEKLGPYKPKGMSEGVYYDDVDAMPMQEVYKELFETSKQVKRFMKTHGVGQKIKTLTKRDMGRVQRFLWDMVDKTFKKKKTAGEFHTLMKDEVQSYNKKGKPKYEPAVIDRIARTELSGIRELTKLAKWKEAGFSKVKHHTHMDNRTGVRDKRFNGRVFEIDYLLRTPKDRIPLHPNCRCGYILHE